MRILLLLRLLDDYRVIKEIERYKWIESERVGWDIGKERATLEWTRAYGRIWLKIHKPQEYRQLQEKECEDNSEVAATV